MDKDIEQLLRTGGNGPFCKYEPACGRDSDIENMASALTQLFERKLVEELEKLLREAYDADPDGRYISTGPAIDDRINQLRSK